MPKKKIKLKVPLSLLLVLSAGLFLRIYKFSSFFQFSHEQDLQAWIVKDILIDHHPRLIGQETSIPGLFIGPLYYYLLVPFFAIFNLDPRASIIPITFISLVTIVSVYYIFTSLYGKKVGIIGSFIYSVSPAIVFLDRWVVPTQPTLLWIIWFYFVLMKFSRGEFKTAPILIVLIGLIWHIHIAFVPLLILVPIAFFIGRGSKHKTNKTDMTNGKYLIASIVIAVALVLPLIAFEFRHTFQQIKGVLNVNLTREGQAKELREGYYKVEVVSEYMNRVIWSPFLYQSNPKNPMIAKIPVLLFVFLGLVYFVYKKKKLMKNEALLIFSWLGIVFLSQMLSKRIISDYYFNNLMIISIIISSLFVSYVYSNKKLHKWVFIAGILFLVLGISQVVGRKVSYKEFEDRKKIVEYIAKDVKVNKYLCVAINYIGEIPVRYGYRYLFWWKGVDQIAPGSDLPVYSIVQPFTISESEVSFRSGEIGIIVPRGNQKYTESVCSDPNRQLLPLNGFVN